MKPSDYGVTDIRPDRSYNMVYNDSKVDLDSFAFYFEHDEPKQNPKERRMAIGLLGRLLHDWWLHHNDDEQAVRRIL